MLFNTYDRVLRDIANQLAPPHNVQRRSDRCAPWFNDECRSARTDCCRRERCYRQTCDIADRRLWVDVARRRFRLYRSKEAFWMDRVSQDSRNSAQLWRSLSTMLGKNRDTASVTQLTVDGFGEFFHRKVEDIRADTTTTPPPVVAHKVPASLSVFCPVTCDEVRRIIKSSPAKSCSLDPMPTFLVCDFVDVLTPFITAIVNSSPTTGGAEARERLTSHHVSRSQDLTHPTWLTFDLCPI